MSKDKKLEKSGEKEKSTAVNSIDIMSGFLANTVEDHMNFEHDVDYVVSTGSLLLDSEMGGGVHPGVIRSCGVSNGGKTSFNLLLMKNFLESVPNAKAIYIKAEGRLGEEMRGISGVNFVWPDADGKVSKWVVGTCLVYKGHVYENVSQMITTLMDNNPEGIRYFFLIDSMDALIPKGDIGKNFEEANKVAGGALLTSDFLRRTSLKYSTYGHICALISQVRSTVKVNQYAKSDPKLTNAGGGNALLHYSDWILDFQSTFKDDNILGPKEIIVGHWAKIIFRKSPNEKNSVMVRYPIKHGRRGGKSVWVEHEIIDMMLEWEIAKKSGAWISLDESVREEAKKKGVDLPEKFNGRAKMEDWLFNDAASTDYLFHKLKGAMVK